MAMKRLIAPGVIAIAASIMSAHAGPCSLEIEGMQTRIDGILAAKAGVGSNATESASALEHRQPTPDSIARAEERLGALPAGTVEAIQQAMGRARAADTAGDKDVCAQELAEVQHLIGRQAQ